MIKLKRFNESVSGNRLTKEDLEEYFIDFIDRRENRTGKSGILNHLNLKLYKECEIL